jgi:YidC/Oxa1 family membrane protein insertase
VVERVERDAQYRAALTSWGGAVAEWTLLNPQYQATVTRDGQKVLQPINLVRTSPPKLPLATSFPQSDFEIAPDAAWTAMPGATPDERVYVWENDRVKVEKRFTFVPRTYELALKITVENKGEKPLNEHLQVSMFGWQDPTVKSGGWTSMFRPRVTRTEGLCDLGGKVKRGNLESLQKEALHEVGAARWVGVDEKYFLAAVAVAGDDPRTCDVSGTADGTVTASLLTEARTVAPKGKTEYELAAFFGPKILQQLDAVRVAGVDAKLGDAVDYGWTEVIARPMLAVLKAIHHVIPNWGLAVIALTILLKGLTWWPTQKSMKSMREMAKLKPEMEKLKQRYGEDKQAMNVAVMELYKQRGVNPLGGCLPMGIQMPIYIALYSMLGNSVELYRSGFVGWIRDLTAPDPYFVLPILTGILMFAQQRLTPTPPDPQQKTMMYTMPVMFTALSMFLPSGLTIYILTNTVLTMLQQQLMNRDGRAPTPKPART